jgi:cell division septation protein DedD
VYFWTYESDEKGPSTADSGILFHKIAPLSIPRAFKVPDYTPPAQASAQAWATDQQAPAQKAPTPEPAAAQAAPAATVPAYVERSYPYVVHIASYQNRDVARKRAADYSRGFQAFLVRTDLKSKGIWYRLHIGHFPDATSAADAINKYFSKGSAVVGHTRYACLFGSYLSMEESVSVSERLSDKGFLPYTVFTNGAYHVFVGAHPTRAAAEALSRELSENGFPNTLIRR